MFPFKYSYKHEHPYQSRGPVHAVDRFVVLMSEDASARALFEPNGLAFRKARTLFPTERTRVDDRAATSSYRTRGEALSLP